MMIYSNPTMQLVSCKLKHIQGVAIFVSSGVYCRPGLIRSLYVLRAITLFPIPGVITDPTLYQS